MTIRVGLRVSSPPRFSSVERPSYDAALGVWVICDALEGPVALFHDFVAGRPEVLVRTSPTLVSARTNPIDEPTP